MQFLYYFRFSMLRPVYYNQSLWRLEPGLKILTVPIWSAYPGQFGLKIQDNFAIKSCHSGLENKLNLAWKSRPISSQSGLEIQANQS